MSANPKPDYAKQARKRKRAHEAKKWAIAYGSKPYRDAVVAMGCIVKRFSPFNPFDPISRRSGVKKCVGPGEAAHVVKKTRPDDPLATWRGTACLCSQHHGEQEQGLDRFEKRYGIVGEMKREAGQNVIELGHLAPAA